MQFNFHTEFIWKEDIKKVDGTGTELYEDLRDQTKVKSQKQCNSIKYRPLYKGLKIEPNFGHSN